MKRQVSYTWRLRNVMADHNMFNTTELVPLLADRGITLSASQVHRLVSGTHPNGCPCPCWPRSATSLTPPPPTSS
jgi:hypothetical protein